MNVSGIAGTTNAPIERFRAKKLKQTKWKKKIKMALSKENLGY